MFKKRKTPEGVGKLQLTTKGIAFYLAMKHGVCPKIDGGYDTTKFEKFWDEFEPHLLGNTISNQVEDKSNESCDESTSESKTPIVPILLGLVLGTLFGKFLLLILKVAGIL